MQCRVSGICVLARKYKNARSWRLTTLIISMNIFLGRKVECLNGTEGVILWRVDKFGYHIIRSHVERLAFVERDFCGKGDATLDR